MVGLTLGVVEHHPYLGAELSGDLSWDHHINNCTKKATRSLNFLCHNISRCSTATKETAYKAIVHPHLEYASTAWDPYVKKLINQLEQLEQVQSRSLQPI